MIPTSSGGPMVGNDVVTFRVADPQRRWRSVGLVQDLRRPRDWTPLEHRDGVWSVDFPRPPVDRIEYQFKAVSADGGEDWFCDPANALRAPGAFGEKSVLELTGYRSPTWGSADARPRGDVLRTTIAVRALRADLAVTVWTTPDVDPEEPLPLLVANDGSEYARYSSLLVFLEAMTASGALPPMRAALLDPVQRDEDYSASAAYTRGLVTEVLPALAWLAPCPAGHRVGMGASLGALAMLHAHYTRPGAFDGLFLQSGSYFRQRYDRQESGFPRFRRISRFVGTVLGERAAPAAIPVTLTCGTVEENLANNRAVAAALERHGYDVRLVVNRDAHNYVGWRDTFDPALTELLQRTWS